MPESKTRKKKTQRPRTTTPKKEIVEPSPKWYVYLMGALMTVGVVLVILSYILQWGRVPLLSGLIAIAAGFLMLVNFK